MRHNNILRTLKCPLYQTLACLKTGSKTLINIIENMKII